jgi:WD40 repeat protein
MRPIRWTTAGAILLMVVPILRAQVLERQKKPLAAFDDLVAQVALSGDGKTVAAAVRRIAGQNQNRWTEFRVWDTDSHKQLASFSGHTDGDYHSSGLALSPQGDMLASCTYDGQFFFRSLKDQRERPFSGIGMGAAHLRHPRAVRSPVRRRRSAFVIARRRPM